MFAVIHVADFALQAVLRTESAPSPAPTALLSGHERSPLIVAASAAARAQGVEPGATPSQALARCGHLRILAPRPDAEREAAACLLAAAWTVSPSVEATAPGVCTLVIDGVAAADREPALQRALGQLDQFGLQATAGIGPTPLLALYAARETRRLLVVQDNRDFLALLPLSVADPPPELLSILASWGVHTLGELTALPKAAVTQRLGPLGLALWERAAGEATRPLQPAAPAAGFSAGLKCEFEMETLEPLLFLLRRLVDRLLLDLTHAAFAAAAVTLRLDLSDETDLTRTLRLAEPTTSADLVFRTLSTHLETVRTEAGIVGVALEIAPARRSSRQPGLFDRALRDPHRFAETLSRVAAIVGADRVGTPALLDSHRPDAVALAAPASEIPPGPGPAVHVPRGLVLRRYRPPQPVLVELSGSPPAPAYVRAQACEGAVTACLGPWRTAGDWWQVDQAWQREEWDIEAGAVYRLVRTPEGWFIEGEYD